MYRKILTDFYSSALKQNLLDDNFQIQIPLTRNDVSFRLNLELPQKSNSSYFTSCVIHTDIIAKHPFINNVQLGAKTTSW